MNSDEFDRRLSELATHWSLVIAAHGRDGDLESSARAALLERYRDPVFRYLLGAVRDFDVAEELSQEFVVRLLRGDFHRAVPEKGRFRDYVNRSLVNLVNDHFRSKCGQPGSLPAELAAPENSQVNMEETETALVKHLRTELLNRTWKNLRNHRTSYYLALRTRVDEPELSAREIANRLTSELGKRISPDSARKTLERARRKFADLLMDEVEASMDAPSTEQLRCELRDLDLLRYCRTSVERRGSEK